MLLKSWEKGCMEAIWGSALQLHRPQAVSTHDQDPSWGSTSSHFTSLCSLVCWASHPVLPTCPALLTGWPRCAWRCPVIMFPFSCLGSVCTHCLVQHLAPRQPRPAYSSREYTPSSSKQHLTPVLTYFYPQLKVHILSVCYYESAVSETVRTHSRCLPNLLACNFIRMLESEMDSSLPRPVLTAETSLHALMTFGSHGMVLGSICKHVLPVAVLSLHAYYSGTIIHKTSSSIHPQA